MVRSRTPSAGSSPLARGLHFEVVPEFDLIGIIPARAGFTAGTDEHRGPRRDHPRSRGVYLGMSRSLDQIVGSSPLARGLRHHYPRARPAAGIIPARAGFTPAWSARPCEGWDHPRSRGVYPRQRHLGGRQLGSSPLARGLRDARHHGRGCGRIIPARAGFTPFPPPGSTSSPDHPRSRGVYDNNVKPIFRINGSSPLARGLPFDHDNLREGEGIIPARAGFTCGRAAAGPYSQDHPRSRGVYPCGSLESQRTHTLPDPGCLHCRPRARSSGRGSAASPGVTSITAGHGSSATASAPARPDGGTASG